MNVLVTAGNTQVFIDRVRCLTNIFTGRTGTRLALHGYERGHTLRLVTSHPNVVKEQAPNLTLGTARWAVEPYRTFDDLDAALGRSLQGGGVDVVIHSAAVSDYLSAGVYAPAPGTRFDAASATWRCDDNPTLVDRTAGKVKSDEPELWLRLVRAPKLVDKVRTAWGFRGVLVKFKLEVSIADDQLIEVAERSRRQSAANLMVANTLEGAGAWAYIGPFAKAYRRVSRDELPGILFDEVERLHSEQPHG
jgi:phosphopantothenoylcysteine synthetase/decarboxylase